MMRHTSTSLLLRRTVCPLQRHFNTPKITTTRTLTTNNNNTTKKPLFIKSPSEDPHQMADRFVKESSSGGRISGTEALESVSPRIKLQNVALATMLVGFVTGVWWYSMNAVGRADEISLELEANEARERALIRNAQEEQNKDLANLEMGVSGEEDVDITVAVAAPDEIASQEEDENQALLKQSERPLWKRVVFFWRK